MLTIYNDRSNVDDDLMIWACQSRNSDQIMVVIADRTCSNTNDMFDDKAWKNARYFKYDDYDSATDFAWNIIKKQYKKNFLERVNYNYQMNYCLSDLERIIEDATNLDYEDYCDLATFEDSEKKYFCDLIIFEGNVGLRYSKYVNDEGYDNLCFEKWDPDLTNEITLMLGMQQQLNNFIDKEEDYEISINNDIKI